VKFCKFFKFFLIALFWPKLLPALFLGESDHSVLIVRVITRDTPEYSAMSEKKPVYRKANFENMRGAFRRTNIVENVKDKTVEEIWETVKGTLQDLVNRYDPMSMTKVGNSRKNKKPLWINPRTLRRVKRKRED
jgi:hypothetical protein